MEVSSSGVAVATSSPSSPVAEECKIPDDDSSKKNAFEEDSKLKEIISREIDTTMLTLEDSTLDRIPLHLECLLSSFDIHNAQPADLLIALIYCVALECSFAAIEEVQRNAHHIKHMSYLSTFHAHNICLLSRMPANIYDVHKMTYNMRLQLIFDNAATPCVLTGIVTGDLFILTLTPDCGDAGGKSICLSIGRYVLNSKGRPFPSRFRKLPELSYKLRELVLIPIRNHMIKKEGRIILYPGLDGMPEELYPFLYVHMNKNGLNKMANVSRRLRDTVLYFKKHMLKK